jgi:hypothetical protein
VRVLEFHHVGRKRRDVSTLVRQGRSWARVAEEILQCVVLCANCHRIREHERRRSFRTASGRLPVVTESPVYTYVARRLLAAAPHGAAAPWAGIRPARARRLRAKRLDGTFVEVSRA